MYQFSKVKDSEGVWRFELDGINLLLDGFYIKEDKHWIENPQKAIAFFNIRGHMYGVSNELNTFSTAEDFYEKMKEQFAMIKKKNSVDVLVMGQNRQEESDAIAS